MMSVTPILRESFYHEGRGPELKKVHYVGNGRILKAIDYLNPDAGDLKHLLFLRPQVFMFTPEEVFDYGSGISWEKYENAAIVCLGKSKWMQSFSQHHLDKCLHYQVMFYDEFLDVICEGIGAEDFAFVS